MINYQKKPLIKLVSLILVQAFLFTGVACPESISNTNISSIYIKDKGLRVPMMAGAKDSILRMQRTVDDLGERLKTGKFLTYLFRHTAEFTKFKELLPELMKKKEINILSLGASTGEEAISILITIIAYLKSNNIQEDSWPVIHVRGFEIEPALVKQAYANLTNRHFVGAMNKDIAGDIGLPECLEIIKRNNMVEFRALSMVEDEAINKIRNADVVFFNMVEYQLAPHRTEEQLRNLLKLGAAFQDLKPGAFMFTTEKQKTLADKHASLGIDLSEFYVEGLYTKTGSREGTYLRKKDKAVVAGAEVLASNHSASWGRRDFEEQKSWVKYKRLLFIVGLTAAASIAGYKSFGPSEEALAASEALNKTPGSAVIYKNDDRAQQQYEAQEMLTLQKNNKNLLSAKETARIRAFLTPGMIKAIKFSAKQFDLEPELLAAFLYEEKIYKDTQNSLRYSVKEGVSEWLSSSADHNGTLGIGQVGIAYLIKKEFLNHLIENIGYFLQTVKSRDDRKLLEEFRTFYKPLYDARAVTNQEIQDKQDLIVRLAAIEEINVDGTGFVIREMANEIAKRNAGNPLIPDASRLERHSKDWLVTRYKSIPQGATTVGDLAIRYGRPFGGKEKTSWKKYYDVSTLIFMVAKRYTGEPLNSTNNTRSLAKLKARILFERWGGLEETDAKPEENVAPERQNQNPLQFKLNISPAKNAPAKNFSLRSKDNSRSSQGETPTTNKFAIGTEEYDITDGNINDWIQAMPVLGTLRPESGLNITFTIRGPTSRAGLVEYLQKNNAAILQEAISRSNALHNGTLDENIKYSIILADKYDYLAGDHTQNHIIIINASDLANMLLQNENPAFVSELMTSLLSEELAHERGAAGDTETEERLAQEGAHNTRYTLVHQPNASPLSEYIDFLEKFAFEAKGERGYLNYLKAGNRYQDMAWTKELAPLVNDRTLCVFQMEMAFSKAFLDNLYKKFLQKGYTKKAAEFTVGRIAQLTMAGGLGNIKRELVESWREKGADSLSFSPLYARWIKGVGNIDNSLVKAVLEEMGEPQFKFKTKIFNRDNVKEEIEVEVAIYRDPFSPSNYWIYCPEIFDGAYPDSKVHLAQQLLLYRNASLEYLLYLHSKGKVKNKFLFSLSEVYTAFLIPDAIEDKYSNDPVLKDIFKHHYNHTVVAAGMPKLPQFLYNILRIKEKYRDSIVQNGQIVLADLIGQESDTITGCSVVHTDVLRKDVMAKYKDKIPGDISEANSEGAFIDNWQGEEIKKIYERYYLTLAAENDEDLFKKLDQDQDVRDRFITDMMAAKERQQKSSREWVESYGAKLKDGVKVASLVRRMVRYKRLDVLVAMLSIPKYREQLEGELGFLAGGRVFDIDPSDFGTTQLNVIRKLSEKFSGLIASIPDNTDYPGYNIFNAHNIYEFVFATIMLSDEDLEAGPTSPSKGLLNGSILIAVMDGVMRELLIDFNEDPVNGNGFKVEYRDPEMQAMVQGFLNSVDPVVKEKILERGDHITPFAFHTSISENNGIVHADSAGLRGFFKTQNRLLNDRVTIFNQYQPEDYINYMLGLFEGVKEAEGIMSWLKGIRDNNTLESYEKYEEIRSFLIEILGEKAEPTVKSLFKALKGFNDAWNDPEKKRRLFYNAFKTGMLKANISTRQGPGLIKIWEQGLESKKLGSNSGLTVPKFFNPERAGKQFESIINAVYPEKIQGIIARVKSEIADYTVEDLRRKAIELSQDDSALKDRRSIGDLLGGLCMYLEPSWIEVLYIKKIDSGDVEIVKLLTDKIFLWEIIARLSYMNPLDDSAGERGTVVPWLTKNTEPATVESISAKELNETTCLQLSKRIAKELNLLTTRNQLPEDARLKYGSKEYSWEEWRGTLPDGETIDPKNGGQVIYFIRIGYLFFLEESKYSQLSGELKKDLGVNVIRIDNLHKTKLGNAAFLVFTMPAVLAMMESGIAGKRVIDVGAGCGILSLVAAKLGALQFVLIEKENYQVQQASRNLSINGLAEKVDYKIIHENLQYLDKILTMIPSTELETVIVSNIGMWPEIYGDVTNIDSMKLIHRVPNVTMFIGAGYSIGSDNADLRQKKIDIIIKDIKAINKLYDFQVDIGQMTKFEILFDGVIFENVAWIGKARDAIEPDSATGAISSLNDALSVVQSSVRENL